MRLIEFKCKNCGAVLKVDPNSDEIKCEHCLSLFKLDDEIKHLKVDDAEKIGYEFEKGRIKAQEEKNENESRNYSQQSKKKNNTVWLVLAWIFLLPFTATYFIAKSKKLNKTQKIIIIAVMWILFLIIGLLDEQEQSKVKKEMITKCYSQETYEKLDELIGMSNIRLNVSEVSECDGLIVKNSDYKVIEIDLNEEKKLVSIIVDGKSIYGEDKNEVNTTKENETVSKETSKSNEDNSNKNTNKENKDTSKKATKADYEFDTIEGYTTLQSLLMNINKNDTYKKIKNMAGYYDYYVKDSTGVEANGTIIIIYNTSYENFQNNYTNSYTEFVDIRFDGFSKKSKIYYYEYQTNNFHYEYNYDKNKGLVRKYGEESKEYNKPIEAFKYINQRIGYNG